MQTWDSLLKGSNTLLTSETGSGKTAAYLVPLLHRALLNFAEEDERVIETRKDYFSHSPRLLILTLNRQLESQILSQVASLSLGTGLSASRYPLPTHQPLSALAKPEIGLSTVASLRHAHKSHRSMNRLLSRTEAVVLDEADALLVQPEGREVFRNLTRYSKKIRPLQLVFCGATLPAASLKRTSPRSLIEGSVADLVVHDTFESGSLRVPDKLQETVAIFNSEEELAKGALAFTLNRIQETLLSGSDAQKEQGQLDQKWILFVNSMESLLLSASQLENALKTSGLADRVDLQVFHGGLTHEERGRVLWEFSKSCQRDRKLRLLLSTGLSARGLDIPSVDGVVNLQVPPSQTEFLHRVGRTARSVRSGWSWTPLLSHAA